MIPNLSFERTGSGETAFGKEERINLRNKWGGRDWTLDLALYPEAVLRSISLVPKIRL